MDPMRPPHLPRHGLLLSPDHARAQIPDEARLCAAILQAGVDAARPDACLRAMVSAFSADTGIQISARDVRNEDLVMAHVPPGGRVALLCLGKCGMGSALTLRKLLGPLISRTLVVDRQEAWQWVPADEESCGAGPLEFVFGNHPLPDEASLAAGRRARDFAASIHPEELLLCCLSGGASSLVELPARGVPGEWLAKVPAALMHAGADIHALLGVRAAMSALKCGGLLSRIPAGVALLCLVLSDVEGDDPADVAGAPLYPPLSSRLQATLDQTLERFGHTLPEGAQAWLSTTGRRRLRPQHVQPPPHVVVSTNSTARQAALRYASSLGVAACDLGEKHGDARDVALALTTWADSDDRTQVAIMGGEAVSEVRGCGRGGPNLEVVAHCLPACLKETTPGKIAAIGSADTDGIDGSTELAGAVAWPELAKTLVPKVSQALQLSDSESLFRTHGGLLWGPSGANVSDLRVVVRPFPRDTEPPTELKEATSEHGTATLSDSGR